MCRETATRKPLWTTALPFVPCWIGCLEDTIVAAGRGGVCSLRLADGEMLWHFPASESLTAFRLPGPQLFFLEGGRRLFALEAETGEVLWSRWAPAARLGLPEPSGKFNPHYFAGPDRVLIQTSGGRRWLLDAPTGQTLQDSEMSTQQWPQPPLALDNARADSFCLSVDPNHIVRLDAAGKELWRFELTGSTSLTGELPQLVGAPTGIAFTLIPRNYGMTLRQLTSEGRSPWKDERLLTTGPLSAGEVTFDNRALYYVSDNILYAHALADGKTLWKMPLAGPQARWRLMLAGQTLIVAPIDAREKEIQPRSSLKSVQYGVESLVPVILCDTQTGQLVQRLNIPLAVPKQAARKLPEQEHGPSGARQAPVLHISEQGMMVAVPGKVCRFVPVSK